MFRGVTPAGEAFPDHHGGAATAISKIRYLGRRGVRTLSSSDVVTEAHGTSLIRILKYNLNRDLSAVFGAYCNLEYVPLEDIFGWANTRLAADVLNLRAVVRARASRDPRVGE